jgi:hypothetical protein
MKKLFLLIGLLIPSLGFAQQYSIDWYKIAGGGGTSTGDTYQVSGTLGQPDASGAMSGGSYSLTGGFWSLYAVQTPGAPLLTITHIGNQAIVSWSPSVTGWTLQTTPILPRRPGATISVPSSTTASPTHHPKEICSSA